MRLILIRHGAAVPQETPGISDHERPLTPEGEKRFREAADALVRILDRPDIILTSPLVRARQTAEIVAAAWGRITPRDEPALASGDIDELAGALEKHRQDATVALVGHEPHLSSLLAHILGSTSESGFAFKKGGVALIEMPGKRLESGQLLLFLPPRALRRLAS